MQPHFDKNNLESPLIGQMLTSRQAMIILVFQDIVLDMAVTYSNMNKLTANMLESCLSISFRNTSILTFAGD
jgi:hypothetical protein